MQLPNSASKTSYNASETTSNASETTSNTVQLRQKKRKYETPCQWVAHEVTSTKKKVRHGGAVLQMISCMSFDGKKEALKLS